MTDQRYSSPPIVAVGDRPVQDVSGVLGSRIFAWIGDAIVVFFLTSLIATLLFVLGIFTFGATWLLIPIAVAVTAFAYAALTIGGPRQATFGMRMAGLRVETANGGRPDGIAAAVVALRQRIEDPPENRDGDGPSASDLDLDLGLDVDLDLPLRPPPGG